MQTDPDEWPSDRAETGASEDESLSDQLLDDPEIGWLFRSLGMTGGTIICVGALILAPIGFWLAEAGLNLEGTPLDFRLGIWFLCWGILMMVVLGPLVLVLKLPAIGRLMLGPRGYRHRWLAIQLVAWFASVAYAAIGIAYWMGGPWGKPLGESIGMHAIPTLLALAGFYLGAMAFMPAGFFDADQMGQAVKRFLGLETARAAPRTCFIGAVGMWASSGALWWICVTTFSN